MSEPSRSISTGSSPTPPSRTCMRKPGSSSSGSPASTRATSPTRSKPASRTCLAPSVIFEDLGLRYYGPIDGHDIPLLDSHLRVLEDAARAGDPSYSHEEGKRLRPGPGEARQIPRPRKISSRHRRNGRFLRNQPIPSYLGRRSPTLPNTTTRSSRSPRPCPAAPGSSISQSAIRTDATTWASPRSTPPSSPAASPWAA